MKTTMYNPNSNSGHSLYQTLTLTVFLRFLTALINLFYILMVSVGPRTTEKGDQCHAVVLRGSRKDLTTVLLNLVVCHFSV